MELRILKTWELWALLVVIYVAAFANFRATQWRQIPGSIYFDQYDFGIDSRAGFFISAWGAFGFHHARDKPWLGFAFTRGDNWPESGNGWYWYIRVPFWAPALLLIPAAVRNTRRLIQWFRNLPRFPAGCCEKCGYDLRATPERCPECGTPAIIEKDSG